MPGSLKKIRKKAFTMYRKLFSMLLAVCMVISLVPAVLAADTDAASIGETGYATLEAAIADASNGDVITVKQDVELTSGLTIPAGLTVTLDLNGKVLSYKTTESKADDMVVNKGNLTITDSTADQAGKLSYQYCGTANTSYSYDN